MNHCLPDAPSANNYYKVGKCTARTSRTAQAFSHVYGSRVDVLIQISYEQYRFLSTCNRAQGWHQASVWKAEHADFNRTCTGSPVELTAETACAIISDSVFVLCLPKLAMYTARSSGLR